MKSPQYLFYSSIHSVKCFTKQVFISITFSTQLTYLHFLHLSRTPQVDPFGRTEGRETVLGGKGGSFESFAFDVRDKEKPRFFVTEDYRDGALRRFTPAAANWSQPEQMLHDRNGTMEYLILKPLNETVTDRGTYEWTTNIKKGMKNAEDYFRNTEGIDVDKNHLFFVSKKQMELFTLDLDEFTWEKSSTESGAFAGQPDALQKIVDDPEEIIYFTEDVSIAYVCRGMCLRYYVYQLLTYASFTIFSLPYVPGRRKCWSAWPRRTGPILYHPRVTCLQ